MSFAPTNLRLRLSAQQQWVARLSCANVVWHDDFKAKPAKDANVVLAYQTEVCWRG
jgi:hypothetical protein